MRCLSMMPSMKTAHAEHVEVFRETKDEDGTSTSTQNTDERHDGHPGPCNSTRRLMSRNTRGRLNKQKKATLSSPSTSLAAIRPVEDLRLRPEDTWDGRQETSWGQRETVWENGGVYRPLLRLFLFTSAHRRRADRRKCAEEVLTRLGLRQLFFGFFVTELLVQGKIKDWELRRFAVI